MTELAKIVPDSCVADARKTITLNGRYNSKPLTVPGE